MTPKSRLARGVRMSFHGVFVNIGDPKSDAFAKGVFEEHLANAPKVLIKSTILTALRRELIGFSGTLGRDPSKSLDIIADAPGGIQHICKATVQEIVHDAHNIKVTTDDTLLRLIRKHFSQCRLLGCHTAGPNLKLPSDREARMVMLALAQELRMPVVGTTRAIASDDFDDMSFRDIQSFRGEERSSTLSTEEMNPSDGQSDTEKEKFIASGRGQQDWLSHFRQVTVDAEDIKREESMRVPIWRMDGDFIGTRVAATGVIRTAAEGIVVLQASGIAFRAEVLASATLLRLSSNRYGPVYLNIPPTDPERGAWLSKNLTGAT